MRRLTDLPPAFELFRSAHGCLNFAVFEEASGDEAAMLAAIEALVPDAKASRLRALGSRRLDDAAFYGSFYDTAGQKVVWPGNVTHLGKPGTGGDFARAFLQPPYNLWQASPSGQGGGLSHAIAEAIFHGVREFVLPPGQPHEVRDWASPQLPQVSPYFRDGMEWWGVFLFTIHVPALRRLTAIAGSTTD